MARKISRLSSKVITAAKGPRLLRRRRGLYLQVSEWERKAGSFATCASANRVTWV